MSDKNADHYFLRGGGEMGELIRTKDWSKTSLGDPANWPQSLCTMVAVMLDNPFGMYIAWGSDYTQLYNDGYRPILGASKHPQALGISTRQTFAEIWHIIESMFDGVMKGKAVGFPDFMLQLNRYGFEEECYFDFSYSPIRKDTGEVGGVLVTVIETTEKKKATEALKVSNARYINNIMQAPVAMCVFRGKNHVVEIANDLMLEVWGKSADQVLNKPIFEGLSEAKGQGLEILLENVFNTGEKFVAHERPVYLPRNGKIEVNYINFVYEALKEPDNTITGIVAIASDVTLQVIARKKIEESDEKLKSLIKNAPFPIGVYAGKEMRIEVANESIIKAWGKGDNVKGKLFNELMPELASQKIFEQLDDVFTSGIPFHSYNQYLTLEINGKPQPYYYNYSFTPLFDPTGKVYGVMNTASDVTDLNVIRKSLEESEQDLRSMALQAPIGICILDASTLVCEIVNDAFIEIAGKPRDAIAGRYYWDTFSEVRPYYEAALNKVVTEGTTFYANEVELMLIRNGKEDLMYVTFVYAPLTDEEGNAKKVAVWVLDNTQQVNARRKIEENTEKLNIVIEASELGTWELNLKNNEPTYSKRYLEILGGYKQDIKLNHSQLLQHLHPDDLPIREKAFKEAFKTGFLHYESRLIWNDKSIHWMEGKGKVFYDEENKPLKLLGTIRDITEEKNHEKELKESEQRFRNLMMQSPVAKAILKGKEHIIEMANDAMLTDIWRKKESEVIGKKIFEVFPELKKQKYFRLLDQVYTTRKKHTEKESFISLNSSDGLRNYYVDFEFAPIFLDDNKISGIKITAVDVTEKVQARKKIEESEERFRSLAQTLPQLTWVTDEKGNAEFASSRWKEYSGIKPSGEKEWRAIVHPDDYDNINAAWIHSLTTGTIYRFDVRLKSKEGEYKWFTVRGEPILDKENKIVKWVGAFTDIQDQKIKEDKKDEFISIASHEMKTPLTIAKAYLQMLELSLDESNEQVKLFASKASQSVNRLNELISELLDVSKIQLGKLNYTITTFNFNDMIESTVENMQLTSPKTTIIKTGVVKDEVTGDKERLQQVIINLLSNAIKYSPGEDKVYITIAQENDIIKVSVQDTGIGIAKQSLEKIFDKYHRADEHAVQFQGLGIGLFISYEIIQRHNGKLWAESEPGKGSTFYFTIPVNSNV